jgi:hypothetical protein
VPSSVSGFQHFKRKDNKKDLMKALAKLYEKPSSSNKVFLMKHLFNMNMSEGGSVADHLNEFNMVTKSVKFCRSKI